METNEQVSNLLKTINGEYSNTVKKTWQGMTFEIKRVLSFAEMTEFIDSVMSLCFSDSYLYLPEVRDFAINSCIIDYYTNIDIVDDVNIRYNTIYCTNLIEQIKKEINTNQLDNILDALDEKIDYRVSTNIDALLSQVDNIVQTLENFAQKAQDSFKDLTPDDIKGFVSSINKGALDEEKIVKAYFDSRENKALEQEEIE
jgi:transcriptional regulator of heat shock response